MLPSDQIQKGFGALVESLDDLLLDVPDAVELLSLFIARGVVSLECRAYSSGFSHHHQPHDKPRSGLSCSSVYWVLWLSSRTVASAKIRVLLTIRMDHVGSPTVHAV